MAGRKGIKFFVFVIVILLLVLAGFFASHYFVKSETNNYIIKNKYYGFKLNTPKNWLAEKNTSYSDENIAQALLGCKNDKQGSSSAYEMGAFRFKDQKYPQNFGDMGIFPAGFKTGAILQVTVNCIPDVIKNKITSYSFGNLKVGGEKSVEGVLNLFGFGNTKYISFFHGGLQYEISEYVYIAPSDKGKETDIRKNYTETFNEIISSFKFND